MVGQNIATKVEVKLRPTQLKKLDAIKSHLGLNTRTDTVRCIIADRFRALASQPHPHGGEGE